MDKLTSPIYSAPAMELEELMPLEFVCTSGDNENYNEHDFDW